MNAYILASIKAGYILLTVESYIPYCAFDVTSMAIAKGSVDKMLYALVAEKLETMAICV